MSFDIKKLRKYISESSDRFLLFTGKDVSPLLDEIERLRLSAIVWPDGKPLTQEAFDARLAQWHDEETDIGRMLQNCRTENDILKYRCHALANLAATSDLNKGKP